MWIAKFPPSLLALFAAAMMLVTGYNALSTAMFPSLPSSLPAGYVAPAVMGVEETDGGWTVQMSDGSRLFFERRPLGPGAAPAVGEVTAFTDQRWIWAFGKHHYGYAALKDAQGNLYHGYRKTM